jgi:hypothetical protein
MSNAVTSYATLGAGVYTVSMALLLGGHPGRWLHAYAWIFLTGIPTLGLHGFGEPFGAPSHPYWSVADTGSNLVLAWALQLAVLGDFDSRRAQVRVGVLSGLVNLAAIGWMIQERFFAAERHYALTLGTFGGFYIGELVLILDSLLVVGLFYRARHRIAGRAMPLLHLVAITFVLGLALATAKNPQIGFGGSATYHGMWHLVGAFGFLAMFVFNQIRFDVALRARGR